VQQLQKQNKTKQNKTPRKSIWKKSWQSIGSISSSLLWNGTARAREQILVL
jgi:hypothetical protein